MAHLPSSSPRALAHGAQALEVESGRPLGDADEKVRRALARRIVLVERRGAADGQCAHDLRRRGGGTHHLPPARDGGLELGICRNLDSGVTRRHPVPSVSASGHTSTPLTRGHRREDGSVWTTERASQSRVPRRRGSRSPKVNGRAGAAPALVLGEEGNIDPRYARAWEEVLNRPLPEIKRVLTDDDQAARDLRQNSPFAGELSEPERRKILEMIR